jgi:hypothetical protein
MERYTISIVSQSAIVTRLLIPLPPTSLVSELIAEILRRLNKYDSSIATGSLQLRLEEQNGPLLDEDDQLQCVVINPRVEHLFATTPATRDMSTAVSTNAVHVSITLFRRLHSNIVASPTIRSMSRRFTFFS